MNKQQLIDYYQEKHIVLETIDLDQWANDKFFKHTIELQKILEGLYKSEYSDNERIIFVADQSKHVNSSLPDLLESLQKFLNSLDISNFFVCVLVNQSESSDDVSARLQSTSTDPVPICIDFYESTEVQIARPQLSDSYLLNTSKTFCMHPWTQLYVHTTGEVYPCCESTNPIGNSKTHSLREIWNSSQMKSLRKSMLEDQYVNNCVKCYEREKYGVDTVRTKANRQFSNCVSHTHETNKDGSLDRFELQRWDVKYSNLCNLKCRTCHHVCSSSWYQDQIKIAGPEYAKQHNAVFFPGKHKTDIIEQLLPHLEFVEEIYFAGGEPLMMEEHYVILDELERLGKFDVKLSYNTNFTRFDLKGRSVFDYWKNFSNVTVVASFDDMGKRGEYIRKGLVWAKAEENRRTMIKINPNATFRVSATLNILNLFTLPDFHRTWVDCELIRISDFVITHLVHPYYLRADILPMHQRAEVQEKYQKHIVWMKENGANPTIINMFKSVINFLNGADNSSLIPEFWEKTNQLDSIRNETALDVIPELRALL
jgi:radical SAM protein with 4Fe4S-binding SPASM domain